MRDRRIIITAVVSAVVIASAVIYLWPWNTTEDHETPLGPKDAFQKSLGYIHEYHSEVILPPISMWDEVRVTPKDLVGHETLVYISGDLREPSDGVAGPSYVGTARWVAVVEWNVVAPENVAYKVTVSDGSLLWAGKVQNNRVTEEKWGYGTVFTEQQALGVAARFILNSPTFKFDGITDTLSVTDIKTLESLPVQYDITLTFESRHAGYGNREGQALAQVITPHRAVVTVVKGSVTSAMLDDQWDELSQKPIRHAS